MPTLVRNELELAVLEARKTALQVDSESKVWQHNNSMELDLRLCDDSVFHLFMLERNRELAELDVAIAKKRLEINELQGVSVSNISEVETAPVLIFIDKSGNGWQIVRTGENGIQAVNDVRYVTAEKALEALQAETTRKLTLRSHIRSREGSVHNSGPTIRYEVEGL